MGINPLDKGEPKENCAFPLCPPPPFHEITRRVDLALSRTREKKEKERNPPEKPFIDN